MKEDLTGDDLLCLYCSLFATITDLKELKRRDHQRYGDLSDERYESCIQAYTALAEKIFDLLEEDDKDEDRSDKG